jgi:hypothetical protein
MRDTRNQRSEESKMIIETSAGQRFSVRAASGIDHAWIGVEVKSVKGQWVPKAKAREILVRKAATKVIEN